MTQLSFYTVISNPSLYLPSSAGVTRLPDDTLQPDTRSWLILLDQILKRTLDIVAATLGLLILSWLLLGLALAVRAHDGGPVFFRPRRVGKDGQLFRLFKFRTMIMDADRRGPGITAHGDTRITPIGRWLRRTKLDELPQLINVWLGHMSLVGPRPEDPRYVALYTPDQREVLRVRPGITSAASLVYRHEERMLTGPDWESVYRSQVMPDKLMIDLTYLSRRNVPADLGLVVRTVMAVFE